MVDSPPHAPTLESQSQQASLSSNPRRKHRLLAIRSEASSSVAHPGGSHCRRRGWAYRPVRSARVTSNQIEVLLAALEAQPFLIMRRFTGLRGKEKYDLAWTKVAEDLNNTINGTVKTPDQWSTVWRDLKSRTCIKAAALKREKNLLDNQLISNRTLSSVQQRIISLVDAARGKVFISMPDEDKLQPELEAGVQIEYVNVNSDEVTIDDVEVIQMLDEKPEMLEIADSGSERDTNEPTTKIDNEVQPKRKKIDSRDDSRDRVAEQHNSARDFLAVAKTNAESMQMIASAAKQQAEAAKLQAEASLLFAQALNKIADALLVGKNKNVS